VDPDVFSLGGGAVGAAVNRGLAGDGEVVDVAAARPRRQSALTYLKRFGSVTVLNGHIHQVLTKVEGTVKFHTAMSTAFPQPAPGSAPAPGPMKIPESPLAIVDSTLG
jgi:hypothetical protein